MEGHTSSAPYNMALDNIDPSEIEQMLQQIRWEQSIGQQSFASSEYDTAHFDLTLSPLSGFASPSSMTTGSTNQSPSMPFLDYDMSFPMAPAAGEPESLFPELMNPSVDMNTNWVGTTPDGYSGPFMPSNDAQVMVSPMYPLGSQLYPTAAPDTSTYNTAPALSPCLTTHPPPATAQSSRPHAQPSSSSSSSSHKAATTDHTCSRCGATFNDKTKLRVHTNKHTKPFRCTAEGCDYATAEKKSLQRHLLARSKWDEEHRAAAQSEGVRQVRHRCPRPGCTYATVREDNLKRHISTCAQ